MKYFGIHHVLHTVLYCTFVTVCINTLANLLSLLPASFLFSRYVQMSSPDYLSCIALEAISTTCIIYGLTLSFRVLLKTRSPPCLLMASVACRQKQAVL